MEKFKFALIYIRNVVTDMMVSEIIQNCENLDHVDNRNGYGSSKLGHGKSWNFVSNWSHHYFSVFPNGSKFVLEIQNWALESVKM